MIKLWVNNSIHNYSLSVLNKYILLLKNNDVTKINNMLYENFDIEKWAKYFALIDIFELIMARFQNQ